MEKLHNRLVDMREAYEELGPQSEERMDPLLTGPPPAFFEPDQPHILLGIANVFLQVFRIYILHFTLTKRYHVSWSPSFDPETI